MRFHDSSIRLAVTLAAALVPFAHRGSAQDSDEPELIHREGKHVVLELEPASWQAFEDPERWIEDLAEPPPLPDASSLLEFDLSVPDPQFRYLIDTESLTIGNDGVVRYVVAVEARSGSAKNLLFEGMNCATEQYKSYAYGSQGGEWRRPRKAAA